ncbi:MAG: V-type ATPase subunit [Clostridia bacterium]|nr:V-type ATPase subunit [Clostridia bacterium]
MNSKASNAVMTRARAKYGNRLKNEDYVSLAGLSSLREIVGFMRSNAIFAPYFEKLASDSSLSRAKLENAVKSAFLAEASRLCGFEKSVGEPMMKYIMLDRETELILDYIINLSLGTPEKMLLESIPVFNSGTKIDFNKLFQINDAVSLSKYLLKTHYFKLASVLPKNDDGVFDISLIEAILSRIKYKMVFNEINNDFPSETAKILTRSILMRIELTDLSMIYRAKKYYNLSENYIRTNMVGYRCMLTAKNSEQILAAENAEEVLRIFSKTSYASKIKKYGIDDLSLFTKKAVIETEIKQLHFSAEPAVVLSAYLRFFENECENITRIIEGISYQVPKEEILANLIISEKGA